MKKNKLPKDPSQRAKRIVDIATDNINEFDNKNPSAVTLGRLGGIKGGKARSSSLTPQQRAEIAQKAANVRWKKSN
jgi:hypothetical protein